MGEARKIVGYRFLRSFRFPPCHPHSTCSTLLWTYKKRPHCTDYFDVALHSFSPLKRSHFIRSRGCHFFRTLETTGPRHGQKHFQLLSILSRSIQASRVDRCWQEAAGRHRKCHPRSMSAQSQSHSACADGTLDSSKPSLQSRHGLAGDLTGWCLRPIAPI